MHMTWRKETFPQYVWIKINETLECWQWLVLKALYCVQNKINDLLQECNIWNFLCALHHLLALTIDHKDIDIAKYKVHTFQLKPPFSLYMENIF